jgi:hypothetical protein
MFTPKQFAALNHYANNLRLSNVMTRDSVASVEDIEKIGNLLFCTVKAQDVLSMENEAKVGFHSLAVISIGPRGGLHYEKMRRDVL